MNRIPTRDWSPSNKTFNFGFTTTSLERERTQLYHLLCLSAIEIKDDEGDTEERLKNSLQNTQSQNRIIDSVRLQAGVHFLEKRLWILGAGEFDEIVAQHWPRRSDGDSQNKRDPKRDNERAAPKWALIPREIPPAARESSAFTEGLVRVRVFEHGELLPEKNIDEESAEQPNLKGKQAEREHDREERR